MSTQKVGSAEAGPKLCGICGRKMSIYNKTPYCGWHKQEDVEKFLTSQVDPDKRSRELRTFVNEFHKAGIAKNMFSEAKISPRESLRIAARKLERYYEALGVLKVGSMVFRLSMPTLLKVHSTNKNGKTARAVMSYVMARNLEMKIEDIAIFFGYRYAPAISEMVKKVEVALLEDEDIICAVDLVREEYFRISQYDD